jgi:hypothetical protein
MTKHRKPPARATVMDFYQRENAILRTFLHMADPVKHAEALEEIRDLMADYKRSESRRMNERALGRTA